MRRILLTMVAAALGCLPLIAQTYGSAKTADTSKTATELRKMEDDWAKAAISKDRATMNRIEADNYVAVMPDGKTRTKQEDMASMDKSNISEFTNGDMDVRVLDENTAEVIGTAHIRGTENGKDISGDYRYTDVFEKQPNGEWKAVSTEVTKVAPASSSE
jgi:ketosteroid isomerase-like protein